MRSMLRHRLADRSTVDFRRQAIYRRLLATLDAYDVEYCFWLERVLSSFLPPAKRPPPRKPG